MNVHDTTKALLREMIPDITATAIELVAAGHRRGKVLAEYVVRMKGVAEELRSAGSCDADQGHVVDGEPRPVEIQDGKVRVSDSAPWLVADDAIRGGVIKVTRDGVGIWAPAGTPEAVLAVLFTMARALDSTVKTWSLATLEGAVETDDALARCERTSTSLDSTELGAIAAALAPGEALDLAGIIARAEAYRRHSIELAAIRAAVDPVVHHAAPGVDPFPWDACQEAVAAPHERICTLVEAMNAAADALAKVRAR